MRYVIFSDVHSNLEALEAVIKAYKLESIDKYLFAGVFKKDKDDNIYYLKEPEVNVKDGASYIVNVGSVGQPRDGNPDAGFCVYDTETGTVRIKRVKYDARKTRDKIIKAGLPADLGDRLLIGE